MTTYYIDPDYGPGGDGSEGAPFDSWADVTWGAGNIYLQKAGTTYAGAAIVPTEANITLGAYDVSADSPYALIDGTGVERPITVSTSLAGLTIQDFEVWGGTGNGLISSASSTHSSGLTVRRCYLHDTYARTDANDSTAMPLFSNAPVIQDVVIRNVRDDGIWINSASGAPVIERCDISGVGQRSDRFTGDCIQIAAWTGTAIIRNCTLENLQDKQAIVGANVAHTLLVEDSTVVGGTIVINGNGANLTVRRCRVSAVAVAEGAVSYGIYNPTTSRATLVDHTLIDCGGVAKSAIYVYGSGASTATLEINNCTLMNVLPVAYQGMVAIAGSGATLTVRNTAFDNTDSVGAYTTLNAGSGITTTLTNNRFVREYSNFIEAQGAGYATVAALEAAGRGSGNSVGALHLSPSYRPLPSSPLIGAGTYIAD